MRIVQMYLQLFGTRGLVVNICTLGFDTKLEDTLVARGGNDPYSYIDDTKCFDYQYVIYDPVMYMYCESVGESAVIHLTDGGADQKCVDESVVMPGRYGGVQKSRAA